MYPENSVRIIERSIKRGALKSSKTNRCLDDMGQNRNKGKPQFYPCHNSGGSQMWILTERDELRPGRDWDRCLDGVREEETRSCSIVMVCMQSTVKSDRTVPYMSKQIAVWFR